MLPVRYSFWNQKDPASDPDEKNPDDDDIEDDIEDETDMLEPLLRSNPDLANKVRELNQLLDPNRITGVWEVREVTRLSELLLEISEPFNGLNRPLTVQEAELMTRINEIRTSLINYIKFHVSFLESEMNRLIMPDDTWDVWDEPRLVYLFGEIKRYLRVLRNLLGQWTEEGFELNSRVLGLMRLMKERGIERQRRSRYEYEDIDERRERRRERRRQRRRERRRERQLAERTPLPDSDVDFRPVLRF
mgnify:CR=1 FL=1